MVLRQSKKVKNMGKRKGTYIFHVLGGPTYGEKERPRFWHNTTPLLYNDFGIGASPDRKRLLSQPFPLVEDFQVILEESKDTQGRSSFGYQVYFYSPSRGYIASFPYWDHVDKDMCGDNFSIPLGDVATPFSDLEQGWEIVIATHERYVYVLQGQFDQSFIQGYDIWFKVYKHLYLSKWKEAIRVCRSMANA